MHKQTPSSISVKAENVRRQAITHIEGTASMPPFAGALLLDTSTTVFEKCLNDFLGSVTIKTSLNCYQGEIWHMRLLKSVFLTMHSRFWLFLITLRRELFFFFCVISVTAQ